MAPTRVASLISSLVLLCVMALAGCTATPQKNNSGTQQLEPWFATFASMAPSNTELVYAINAQDQLLGVCSQCDFPPSVQKLPKVGSFTTPNLEKLAALHPSGVLLVSGQEAIANQLNKHGIASVVFRNTSLKDISSNIRRLGKITHRSALAMSASSDFDKQIDLIRSACAQTAGKPKVLFCVWPEPMMAVGHDSYLNEAITVCGGTNLSGNMTGDYPHFSAEKLLIDQPDVIILPHEADTADFLKNAPWSSLNAVKQHHVYFLPDKKDDRLSRPTMRVVQGLRWLAKRIHPEADIR